MCANPDFNTLLLFCLNPPFVTFLTSAGELTFLSQYAINSVHDLGKGATSGMGIFSSLLISPAEVHLGSNKVSLEPFLMALS